MKSGLYLYNTARAVFFDTRPKFGTTRGITHDLISHIQSMTRPGSRE